MLTSSSPRSNQSEFGPFELCYKVQSVDVSHRQQCWPDRRHKPKPRRRGNGSTQPMPIRQTSSDFAFDSPDVCCFDRRSKQEACRKTKRWLRCVRSERRKSRAKDGRATRTELCLPKQICVLAESVVFKSNTLIIASKLTQNARVPAKKTHKNSRPNFFQS